MKSIGFFACSLVLLTACTEPESLDASTDTSAEGAAAGAGPAGNAPGDALATDQDRILYAIGIVLGGYIGPDIGIFDLSADEFAVVTAGIADAVNGVEPRVDMDVYGPEIQGFADERRLAQVQVEKAAAEVFAAEIAAEPGAEISDSGLIFNSTIEGDGASPSATDRVTVHYHGTLRDGSVFDSSVESGQPVSFALNDVIPCWTEGVQKLKVGGKAKLFCPSELAYGDNGVGGIPGGASLLFEVELIAIE